MGVCNRHSGFSWQPNLLDLDLTDIKCIYHKNWIDVILLIFTVCKRSCGKAMFLHLSVILFTGVGVVLWMGCHVRGFCERVVLWGGVLQKRVPWKGFHGWGCHEGTPLLVNKRAVCILLECFLVPNVCGFLQKSVKKLEYRVCVSDRDEVLLPSPPCAVY